MKNSVAVAVLLVSTWAHAAGDEARRDLWTLVHDEELTPLTAEQDRAFCTPAFKANVSSPIEEGTVPPDLAGALGKPLVAMKFVLSESDCSKDVRFRVDVTAWEYRTEEEARGALTAVVAAPHSGPTLKSVHRLWRWGATVFLASARAGVRHRDRLEAWARARQLPHSCAHR